MNPIQKYEFKTDLPLEFEIVAIEKLYQKSRETITSAHRAGFYHILWFTDQNTSHTVDFETLNLPKNTLLFLSKDTVQQFDENKITNGFAILFTHSFFAKEQSDSLFLENALLFQNLFTVSQIAVTTQNEIYQTIFIQMQKEFSSQNPYKETLLQKWLSLFLHYAENDLQKSSFNTQVYHLDRKIGIDFKKLLNNNYLTQKRVTFYTQSLGINEKKLQNITSTLIGKTPKEMIDERIMLEAKRILSHTRISIKEIAFFLGFEEPTNFIKFFKKHTQQTPKHFRDLHQKS